MPEKIKEINPPKGLARLAYRLPIWFYKMHLGWLLGNRFLLLTHIGRKSGKSRQTVLEVVRYDPLSKTFIIASGFGKRSDWLLNITANPSVKIQSGRISFSTEAKPLSPEEAGQEMFIYNQNHPAALKELARFMGYQLNGTDEDVYALGAELPMFVLKPLEVEGEV
jgi:deazaflavin-dependent oxidoreductase (nitroreductase family)